MINSVTFLHNLCILHDSTFNRCPLAELMSVFTGSIEGIKFSKFIRLWNALFCCRKWHKRDILSGICTILGTLTPLNAFDFRQRNFNFTIYALPDASDNMQKDTNKTVKVKGQGNILSKFNHIYGAPLHILLPNYINFWSVIFSCHYPETYNTWESDDLLP